MNKYKLEREALENAFVRRMLLDYDIREVTPQRQAKNGTREFEFPVSSLSPKTRYGNVDPTIFPKLRLACFKTGYVRKQNGTGHSPYQVNPTYKRGKRWVFLEGNKTVVKKYITVSRAKIYSGIARLNYMIEFYLRNYAK